MAHPTILEVRDDEIYAYRYVGWAILSGLRGTVDMAMRHRIIHAQASVECPSEANVYEERNTNCKKDNCGSSLQSLRLDRLL